MVTANRNEFEEGSRREDEWHWYDFDGDWRVCVADQGCTRPNRFNVLLGTDLYESKYEEGRILADTRVHAEGVLGYEKALARAAELMREAEERIEEYEDTCKRCERTFKEAGGEARRYYAYDLCTSCANEDSYFA